LERVNQRGQLDAMLRELPAMRSTTTEIMTRMAYQTEYGIFNHEDPRASKLRPLALVAMHDKEDVVEGSPYASALRRFYSFKMHTTFGMTAKQFFDLPVWETELYYDMAASALEESASKGKKLEKQMQMELDLKPPQ
jgi:hypothetical protein